MSALMLSLTCPRLGTVIFSVGGRARSQASRTESAHSHQIGSLLFTLFMQFLCSDIWSDTSLFTFGYQCSFSAIQINMRTSATLGEDHRTSNTSQEHSQSAFQFHGEAYSSSGSRHWQTEANLQ